MSDQLRFPVPDDLGLPPASGNFDHPGGWCISAKFQPNALATGFFDVRYALPAAVVRGKAKVTVKFQAEHLTGGLRRSSAGTIRGPGS